MTEKVCQLYEEGQVGKTRNGRKAIPDSKMPDLGWDITEQLEVQEVTPADNSIPLLLETVTAIIILLVTFITSIGANIQEISREIIQSATDTTRKISRNKFLKEPVKYTRKHYKQSLTQPD